MDEKDHKIEELEKELASYKNSYSLSNDESIKLLEATGKLMKFSAELFERTTDLLTVFNELSKHSGECTVAINKHYIAYKEGAAFDPEFVRVEIGKLVDGIGSSTDSMSAVVDHIKNNVDTYLPAFEEARGVTSRASKNDS